MWHHVNYMKSNCTDIICSLAALWLHFWSSCKTECFCNCPNWWWNFRCSETVGYLFLSTASTVSGILLLRNSWAFVSDGHTCCVCLVNIALSETPILWFCTTPAMQKWEDTCNVLFVGIFWVSILESILGSCHSPPQLEREGVDVDKKENLPGKDNHRQEKLIVTHDEA